MTGNLQVRFLEGWAPAMAPGHSTVMARIRSRLESLPNQTGSIRGLVHIRLEEHENHHAGDRNVEPNGERQACDSTVHREPARQREKERREHHWQRDDGKNYVAS